MSAFVKKLMPHESAKLKLYTDKMSIFKKFGIDKKLDELLNPIAPLKSGGYLVINPTEALVSIDVNSGKYVGKNKVEDTIFQVNKEATIEIARQLRLRDVGGIVVIDFIVLPNLSTRNKLRDIIKQESLKDRSKVQIEEFTRLDLLELTRKHICGKA